MVDRITSNGLTGAVVGDYRIEHLVEQGDGGPIFQVYAKTTGTRYLMRFNGIVAAETTRMLSPAARLVFLGHFQQEAKLIATLQHPHILPLHDYGNFHSLPYLVYPQLGLKSLNEVLQQQSLLPLSIVGKYLQQITSALDYAHERAVLHRNLSGECIYLQPRVKKAARSTDALVDAAVDTQPLGQLLVAEFGLRRIAELSRIDLRTAADSNQRRPAYNGRIETSAPELLLGQPIDTYTDTYACGVVLYRLLTGHAPFEGETRDEIARQHLYAQVPPLHKWRKDAPGTLNEVLQKALDKDPSQRYRKPAELAQAYEEAMMALVAPEPTPTKVVSSRLSITHVDQSVRQQSLISRRRVLVLAGVVGGISGVGIAGVFAAKHFLPGKTPLVIQISNNGQHVDTVTQKGPQSTLSSVRPLLQASPQRILAHVSDLPVNSAKTFPLANQQQPGVLVRLSDKIFVAFDSTCTHASCSVAYNAQTRLLECPCHGATFDPAKKAAVVSGPAQSPLVAINIQVKPDGTITIK